MKRIIYTIITLASVILMCSGCNKTPKGVYCYSLVGEYNVLPSDFEELVAPYLYRAFDYKDDNVAKAEFRSIIEKIDDDDLSMSLENDEYVIFRLDVRDKVGGDVMRAVSSKQWDPYYEIYKYFLGGNYRSELPSSFNDALRTYLGRVFYYENEVEALLEWDKLLKKINDDEVSDALSTNENVIVKLNRVDEDKETVIKEVAEKTWLPK